MQARRLWTTLLSVGAAMAIVNPVSAAASTGPSTDGMIVWSNRAADGSEHLLIARADGSHQRDLTHPAPDTRDADAQISPNGRWIAYQHNQGETETIHLVRPDGSDDHLVDVGCVDPCVAADSPTWLSNSRIAFSLMSGPFDDETGPASVALYTARIDGSKVRRLSEPSIDGVYEDAYLRVAPDHRYLTFLRRRIADETSALFRMAPDGSQLRQLTPYNLRINVNDLSTARHGPTKDLLIFDSARGDTTNTFVDIGTVPTTCRSLADCTSKIRWLTDNAATGRRNANPQWSPDGTSLVLTDRASSADTNAEIWTMHYPESTRRKVSTSPNFDYRPTWGASRGGR